MELLNEIYFGKTPILPAQKQLTILRNKLKNNPVTATTNIDPEIIKFNRIIEDIFGFNKFALYIQPDNLPNAYAFPVDTYFTEEEKERIRKSLIASPTGFKYSKVFPGVSLIIAIHSGLLDSDEYSDEEIMAAILHEIGHGFFEAVTDRDGKYTASRKMTKLLNYILNISKQWVKQGKHGKSFRIDIAEHDLNFVNGLINSIKKSMFKVKSIFMREAMEDNMKKSRLSYTNEKFADTFAAIYGYAEECHSIDIKIFQNVYRVAYGVKKYPKIIETLKAYKMYGMDLLNYIIGIQDEHPEELARIKVSIEYLKRELQKDTIDPAMKKEIIIEIEKLKKLIDDYINYPKDNDSMRILRIYSIMLYKKFGGDRREKDTDNNALFDAIDRRYDALKGDQE